MNSQKGSKDDLIAYKISPLGDLAAMVNFGDRIDMQIHAQVKALFDLIKTSPHPAIIEVVPSYSSLAIYYDPRKITEPHLLGLYDSVLEIIEKYIALLPDVAEVKAHSVEIPVCYLGEFAPDLDLVAKHASLTVDEVISLHAAGEYFVYMLGFMPGFPYLGGMSETLAMPRRGVPREAVPAGSVGIGGLQTGIYPYESPGGWNIIGRTPLKLFDLERQPPNLLQICDRVKFNAITAEEFGAFYES